ncbi:MAG: AAA family ATPase [Candidatus Tectomicrobia bacterium]|nr:AAA family ATPase [Candidatus Tectomicrobia bacterium]
MYCSFFGLQEKPFSITPDPRYLFLSQSHQEALGHLLYGIEERKGFIAITGEVGTGKTLLCRALLDRLSRQVRTALIFNSFMSELDLLRSINEDFGIPPMGATRKELIDHLNRYLIGEFSAGRNAVLIIDEAQNLAPPVLEQIRMLSNLETERGKLLQIVLVGQPELRKQLARPDLRQLNQRIALRYHLQPFNRQATEDYIKHRLLVAGSHGSVKFSRGAMSSLFRRSNGVPRKINLLCDRAMLAAYVCGSSFIKSRHVRQAWLELEGDADSGFFHLVRATPRRTFLVAPGLVLGLSVMLGGAAWLGFYRPQPLELPTVASSHNADTAEGIAADASSEAPTASEGERLADVAIAAPPTALSHLRQETSGPTAEGIGGEISAPQGGSDPHPRTIAEVNDLTPANFPGEVLLRALLTEYQRDPQPRGANAKATLLQVASSFGLEMLPVRIDVNRLKQFRVACVVETYTPDLPAPRFQIVRGISSAGIELTDAAGEIQRLTEAEFVKHWPGQVYLFHRRGLEFRSILAPGRQHPQVWALQQRLGELGYLQEPPSGFFDEPTTEAVRRFQKDHALQVDGTAGPATKMVLYHLVGRSLAEGRQE